MAQGQRRSAGVLSHRTVQYHHRILSKALNDTIKMELIAFNPCKGISAPKPPRTDIRSMDPEQLTKLLNVIQNITFYEYNQTLLLESIDRSA